MIDLDWRVIGVVALIFFGLSIGLRLLSQYAVSKVVDMEYEHVLNSEEHKVRGKYE